MSTPPPQPVVVLVSGRGSNMRALVEQSREPASGYEVVAVLSDHAGAGGLGAAQALGITSTAIPFDAGAGRARFEDRLSTAIDGHAPSLIVLAGFMRVLSAQFVDRYVGRILNIHPSLLPKYPGLHTHRRVLAAADRVHGATVHFVTAELDGGPRVIQARIAVLPDDDEDSLAARVQRQEHRIYPLAVNWHAQGRLRCRGGQAWLDGAVLAAPVIVDPEPSGLEA